MEQQPNSQQLESMFSGIRATEFNEAEPTEPSKRSEEVLYQSLFEELETEEAYINKILHAFCSIVQNLGIDDVIERLKIIEPDYPELKGM